MSQSKYFVGDLTLFGPVGGSQGLKFGDLIFILGTPFCEKKSIKIFGMATSVDGT